VKENPEYSLGPVNGECGPCLAVPVSKEASEGVGGDSGDVHIPLEPTSELAQVSQVSLPRSLALAICPELCVEALDSCRELHGFTSLLLDSQAVTMNALFPKPVNGIMRTIREIRASPGHCCLMFGNVAATQALCALISPEVGIDA